MPLNVREVAEELDFCDECAILYVEVNGVVHEVHSIIEDSQGVTLRVDTDQEERDMR